MDGSSLLSTALAYWWVLPLLGAIVGYKLVFRLFGVIIVPEGHIGIVTKEFVLFGEHKSLPDGAIVALNGEAGLQVDPLPSGLHFFLWPWQYKVEIVSFYTISEGMIGVVQARDGTPLTDGHVLAKRVECDKFQDARAFLKGGGERGPQIAVIPPGTYRINTGLFTITEHPAVDIPQGSIGIVTVREGQPLPTGEIAGPEIPGHNMFQDGQSFVDAGGFKGLQTQIMNAGRYFINPLFASIEQCGMTEVEIAHVGVVIAFVGSEGVDVTGKDFKHGNIVSRGQKGVWSEVLDPGRYPINPRTHKVVQVSTQNVVLNWATGKTESHALDKNLCTITVRSSDGFPYNLDVSQIIHVPREAAPKVIARFGDMENLVTQVLEPTIGNYFRNSAQSTDVIGFLSNREKQQNDAKIKIGEVLALYDVGAVDTLIGDIAPPPELMKTLTDRKIAHEERTTYATQKLAEDTRRELEEAKAVANTQAKVVDAQRRVTIAEHDAQSSVKKAEGDTKVKTLNATADATVKTVNAKAEAEMLKLVGDAEGEKVRKIGTAESEVIKMKTDAFGSSNFAGIEIARHLAENKIKLVPEIMVGGGSQSGGSMLDVVIGGMVHDRLKETAKATEAKTPPAAPSTPATP